MKPHQTIPAAVAVLMLLSACSNTGQGGEDSRLDELTSESTETQTVHMTENNTETAAETNITPTEEAENENDTIDLEGTVYELIGAYVDDENNVRVDMTSWQVSEDYGLFRQYFFGEWDTGSALDTNITIDDSEDFLAMDRYIYYFENFFQISDNVLAFKTGLNAEIKIFWLETDNPDIMYVVEIEPSGWFYAFDIAMADVLTKTPAAPREPSNDFLSIFKLHEMASGHGIPLELLTNIDHGMIDGIYYLHSAKYDFYPMYLVSEADDKIEIRTSIGNLMETDLEPISVLCTFRKEDGEWVRTVEFDNGAELQ